jgi:ElaB/YqjD/DUF883 family membrane-anchored ribosome-binding protein
MTSATLAAAFWMGENQMTETSAGSGPGERVGEWGKGAARKTRGARQPVADKLHDAASAIRGNAERLYGRQGISEGVSDVAQAAADRIDASASYLESHDIQQMAQDLGAVVKRYPTQSLLIAGAVGFLCGRALRSR